jgi:hypothetical protein
MESASQSSSQFCTTTMVVMLRSFVLSIRHSHVLMASAWVINLSAACNHHALRNYHIDVPTELVLHPLKSVILSQSAQPVNHFCVHLVSVPSTLSSVTPLVFRLAQKANPSCVLQDYVPNLLCTACLSIREMVSQTSLVSNT